MALAAKDSPLFDVGSADPLAEGAGFGGDGSGGGMEASFDSIDSMDAQRASQLWLNRLSAVKRRRADLNKTTTTA